MDFITEIAFSSKPEVVKALYDLKLAQLNWQQDIEESSILRLYFFMPASEPFHDTIIFDLKYGLLWALMDL